MTTPGTATSLDLRRLRMAYRTGALRPTALAAEVSRRIAAAGDDKVWISRVPEDELRARAEALERLAAADPTARDRLPLFGVPFAVKDNIDVAGLPTTAACPDFAYRPARSATVVDRLLAAGAILVGKTNLDQFATGLVGVRSPYGVARNPFDSRYIPGGSSSGSAVAVAAGMVSFALGTDTAGSGRVPAAFNSIVGLKPTRGLISASGVVPACRSLDCVSIFALAAEDARAVLEVAAGLDETDPYSRSRPDESGFLPARFRVGVPQPEALDFFGNTSVERIYRGAIDRFAALGGRIVEIDYTPLKDAAALLYQGPWVAERLAALEAFMATQADTLLPVTRAIIAGGQRYSAVDLFKATYRLEALRREAERLFRAIDVLAVPSAGTIYRIAEVEADPVRLNTNLGTYTNFVNLLDLAAIAVPAGFQPDGLPAGITLIGPAFADAALAQLAGAFQAANDLPLGATGIFMDDDSAAIPLAVFGAHMGGGPLNGELRTLGGRLLRPIRTAPRYRLYALENEGPARPGLVRVESAGASIDGELWAVPAPRLGGFVAGIAPPLGIGTVLLDDGSAAKGFLCEGWAANGARDITEFGGWRAYRAASSAVTRAEEPAAGRVREAR